MTETSAVIRGARFDSEAQAGDQLDPALNVAVLYQDSLTRHWATELWARVGQLIGGGSICPQSWRMSDLVKSDVMAEAVRAAADADVLVVSVRDTVELPLSLYVWIEGWLPCRAGRAGALVALIGVPPQPNAQSGLTHRFLERVARKAGLDYLPRERKLLAESYALTGASSAVLPVNAAVALAGGATSEPADRRAQLGIIWRGLVPEGRRLD